MSEQEQAQQPMETEPATAAPDSPMVAEPTPSPSGEGEVAKEGEQAPAQEEPKQEVLVLGLDYGTQKCVLAVTRSAEMFPAIVQNNLANQVTPNVVSFRERRRLIGEEAAGAMARAPNAALHSVKRFLGQSLEEAQKELNMLPFEVEEKDGKVFFKVPFQDEEATFSPEEVASMMIKTFRSYIESNFAANATEITKGCVVAVPSSFNAQQRRAIADAATIAGLPVLQVIDEATAVALCYGLKRRDARREAILKARRATGAKDNTAAAAAEEEKTQEDAGDTVLFVDMGHSYLNVLVASYGRSKLTVLASLCDASAGAREFDYSLARHFAEEIQKKLDVDVLKNKRLVTRLVRSCEKTKQVLSTIDETFCEVENLADVDFRSKISRAKFEEISKEVTDKIGRAIGAVLEKAGKKATDLSAVEIVGGGSRIPLVQTVISNALEGRQLNRTLDSAGSVAIGSTLMAAILSPEIELEYTVENASSAPTAEEGGLAAEEVAKAQERQRQMEETEQRIVATENKRNEIEQFIYHMRDKTDDNSLASCFNGNEKQALLDHFASTHSWVDDNSGEVTNGNLELFEKKFEELKESVKTLAPGLHARLEQLREEQEQANKKAAEEAANYVPEKREKVPRTKKQKIQEAGKKRNQGNIVFKEFDYENAAKLYVEALGYLADLYDLSPEEQEEVNALKVPCLLNTALCYTKINRYPQAVENCNKALEIEKSNVKALFRRAQCHVQLSKLEDAKKDLDAALQIEPNNAAVKKELALVEKKIAAQKEKEKKMYSKMFS
ncbi:DnaK family superfamily protein [Acanthamoeba castellanii str. Neff]|uniref:DnaK family superfamily protein n=1 Tax=Acanthamoeba castellanii (strain ATCC 30010 / Neff) TaxID=1257118 RepID=L8GMB3_ACACF|nr:DnaK family superfamily protein [Acanthamoeba castellanii str. Neff]ELR14102.1 DnaK family superfamily protein [Acanthamoeba castellanii str. Neff]